MPERPTDRAVSGGSELPTGLSNPARRALTGAGYTTLEQLAQAEESELLRLHGVGPKALDEIREALAASGQAFADGS